MLVVLGSEGRNVICLRATTDRGDYYRALGREGRLAGCVVYEDGLPPVFPRRTLIDTYRVYPVSRNVVVRDFSAEPRRHIGAYAGP
jgi:hypothetical protein